MSETLDLLMFACACLFLMSGYPVAFTLAGTALIFGLIGHYFGIFDTDVRKVCICKPCPRSNFNVGKVCSTEVCST